jgi:NSS family neurotransmitter:Na+ symporter
MPRIRQSIHGEWSSRWTFILAATGSAVGLGNIWRFPYLTAENGGGAFVFIYLACVAVIGIPVLMAEILIGRRGRQSPINTMETLAIEAGDNPHWKWLGWFGVIAGFLILSYYSVIGGWTLSYVLYTASNSFSNATADGVNTIFSDLVGSPGTLIAWHSLFMLLAIIVVSRGVKAGLEVAVKFMMPALFIMLLILVGYSTTTGEFAHALDYLFTFDFETVKERPGAIILDAMGQAFFSLSLGMGAIMVYGSYLPHDASIFKASIGIAFADTLVAVLAGLAIFPIVFAYNMEPNDGAGLIFTTLPIAFGQMPGGSFFGAMFFLLLAFAAWTSAISLIEPAVAWLVENKNLKRRYAASYIGIACWFLGLLTVFSFNTLKDFHPLEFIDQFGSIGKKNIFNLIDGLTSNIMLPLGGIMVSVFAIYIMSREATRDELDMGDGIAYKIWRVLVMIAPVSVGIVFLNAIGVFG